MRPLWLSIEHMGRLVLKSFMAWKLADNTVPTRLIKYVLVIMTVYWIPLPSRLSGDGEPSEEKGVFVDFSPVQVSKDFTIKLMLVASDGTKLTKEYNVQGGSSPKLVRDLIEASANENGWLTAADNRSGLSITGLKKKSTIHGITRCAIEVVEFGQEVQPKIRLPK
jgi:hypothetical protein